MIIRDLAGSQRDSRRRDGTLAALLPLWLALASCSNFSILGILDKPQTAETSASGGSTTYTVAYDANGAGGGSVPIDGNHYRQGAPVTVAGNPGALFLSGHAFVGWNTQATGTATTFTPGQTFPMSPSNVTLYAAWSPTYTVTYDANGATGGSVPDDGNRYLQGAAVSVLGNTGGLVRTGHAFAGWNTKADGSGTTYPGGGRFAMGAANLTLWALWTQNPTYTVTYSANGATGGSVPVDSNSYLQGATVSVLGNTGGLVKTGYAFAGWNTQAGGGVTLAEGQTFTITSTTTLHAVWVPSGFAFTSSGSSITVTGCTPAPSGSLTIPGGVTGIDKNAFNGANALTSVSFPSSLTLIDKNAFQNCSTLTNVNFPPSGAISLGQQAFHNCTALTTIDLPPSVSSIGKQAFHGCSSLMDVTVEATTPPPAANDMFAGCPAGLHIHVPAGSVSAYQGAPGWSAYASQIVSP